MWIERANMAEPDKVLTGIVEKPSDEEQAQDVLRRRDTIYGIPNPPIVSNANVTEGESFPVRSPITGQPLESLPELPAVDSQPAFETLKPGYGLNVGESSHGFIRKLHLSRVKVISEKHPLKKAA